MRKRWIVCLILLFVLMAGAFYWVKIRPVVHHRPRANVSEFENEVTEGLLRGVFTELQPAQPQVYFIAFGENRTPPNRKFLHHFEDVRPHVRGYYSAATPPTLNKTFEIHSGRQGIIIQIIKLKEMPQDRFDVWVSFSHLPPGHDQFIYRMIYTETGWIIGTKRAA